MLSVYDEIQLDNLLERYSPEKLLTYAEKKFPCYDVEELMDERCELCERQDCFECDRVDLNDVPAIPDEIRSCCLGHDAISLLEEAEQDIVSLEEKVDEFAKKISELRDITVEIVDETIEVRQTVTSAKEKVEEGVDYIKGY